MLAFRLSTSFIFKVIYLFSAVLDLHCCVGFSVIVVSRGYSLAAVHRLLIVVASLVAEHRLESVWVSLVVALGLSSFDSWALEYRLSSCVAWA